MIIQSPLLPVITVFMQPLPKQSKLMASLVQGLQVTSPALYKVELLQRHFLDRHTEAASVNDVNLTSDTHLNQYVPLLVAVSCQIWICYENIA